MRNRSTASEKRLTEGRQILFGHAGAAVHDGYHYFCILFFRTNDNGAAVSGIVLSVSQHVADHALKVVSVGHNAQPRLNFHVHVVFRSLALNGGGKEHKSTTASCGVFMAALA